MGIEVSMEAVPNAIEGRGWFGSSRFLNVWPSRFEELKTPVTVDVLEVGLILAFVMVAFCFYIVLPGIRGSEVKSTAPVSSFRNFFKDIGLGSGAKTATSMRA